MNFFIEFDPKAELEYLEAIEWYEEQLIRLGERFENSVDQLIELISKTLLIYPNKNANIREGVV